MNKSLAAPLSVLLLASLAVSGVAAENPQLDPKQVYVKQATWAETMLATRANCGELLKDEKEFQLQTTPLPKVWALIAKDWPEPCAWFRRDLPGHRYLDWFKHARDVSFEKWIMGLVLPRLGPAEAGMRQEFEELQRAQVRPDDPRWLGLYGRACRMQEAFESAEGLWLGELRTAVAEQAAELNRTQTPAEDARWGALKRQAQQCVDSGSVAHEGSVAELRAAVEALQATLPSRFTEGEALRRKLAEAEPAWAGIVAAVLQQDAQALGQLPALHREVREFRRSLLRRCAGCRSSWRRGRKSIWSRNGNTSSRC